MSLELSAEQLLENWNKLIAKANGDYIWLLHHDESWQKEKKEYSKFILSRDDADNKIYPTLKDIKNVLDTQVCIQ